MAPNELAPSWTVVGPPGFDLRMDVAAVPAREGPGAVLLSGRPSDDDTFVLPETLVLSGVLPAGPHPVEDVWDGVSSFDVGLADPFAHAAGDVNDDGHEDLWLGNALFFGPILGRSLRAGEADAWIDTQASPPTAAGFDADRDGHEDVLLGHEILYGPFSGRRPGPGAPDYDPQQSTSLGDPCASPSDTAVLDDHLGPDHPAIALRCELDTTVFDLWQAPGARRTDADALASARFFGSAPWSLDGVGDLDGDGLPDVVFAGGGGSLVLKGPVTGWVPELPPAIRDVVGGRVQSGVGDLDGDGVEELLARWDDPESPGLPLWVVMFSPHADPLDLSQGLVLTRVLPGPGEQTFGRLHPDLDGDGLDDLVWTYVHREDFWFVDRPVEQIDAGEVSVWYGRDLLDAWAGRR